MLQNKTGSGTSKTPAYNYNWHNIINGYKVKLYFRGQAISNDTTRQDTEQPLWECTVHGSVLCTGNTYPSLIVDK